MHHILSASLPPKSLRFAFTGPQSRRVCVWRGGHALGGGAWHLSPGGYIQQKCGTTTRTTLASTEQEGIADSLPEWGMYVYYVRDRYSPRKVMWSISCFLECGASPVFFFGEYPEKKCVCVLCTCSILLFVFSCCCI